VAYVTIRGFPKSNAGASAGDFCYVRRTDGRVAIFVYLYPQGRSRAYFFGALAADVLSDSDPKLVPPRIRLTEQVLLHIKCFQENETPIAGNILDRIDPKTLSSMRTEADSNDVGSIHRVWGHRTIVNRANAIAP
jgi:hypothetical protein